MTLLRLSLMLFCFLGFALTMAAEYRFEALGDPVKVRNLSFYAVTQDPDGFYIAWAAFHENGLNRSALVGVRTDNGDVIWHDLSKYREGKVILAQGADGNVYVYAGNPGHFFRYDAAKRELTDLGVPADPASYYLWGKMGPDGRFYVGTYPKATPVYCDTRTGKIGSLGRLTDDERECYACPSPAVSDDNVVYCPVGLHHMELYACDVRTGGRKQILPPPLTEKQGSPTVWTGTDGKVYGKAPSTGSGQAGETAFLCLPDQIEIGKTGPERHRPALLAGDKVVGYVNEEGKLDLTDTKTHARTWLQTKYEGSRAWIFSVSCERDGKVYGSCALPGRSFCYDTATGRLTDLGILGSGKCQVYDTISLPQGLFLGSYMGAYVDLYDPAKPIKQGTNPRHLGRAEGQERPVQWCLTSDGMLYTGTEPAKGRLGGAIMRVNPADLSLKVWPTPIPNQSIEYLAAIPETGELFCATSIQGGSSAISTEKAACVFLWDTKKEEMVFRADPIPGTKAYGRAVRGRNGLIYGVVGGKYYAFDPKPRKVVFTGDLPVKYVYFPQLNREPVGPRGLIYGLGQDAVFAIDPADNSAKIVARDPSIGGGAGKRGAFGFFVTQDGVLYYGSGATLMRCFLRIGRQAGQP